MTLITVDSFLIFTILFAGFYMACNIGANDVANAMGTSVGSKAINLRQAIIIAAVLEFCGAFFFGGNVSETIQSGILKPDCFIENPRLLVFGMLSSLIGTGMWLQIASYFGWPVSATHTIVGALIGVGMLVGGIEAIYWQEVSSILLSWLFSPFVGCLISFGLYTYLSNTIYQGNNPVQRTLQLLPRIAFLITVLLSMILMHQSFSFGASLLFGIGSFAITTWVIRKYSFAARLSVAGEGHYALDSFSDASIEKIFGWLQVMSACLMAFAHGANDVANAIGPVTAAIATIQGNIVASTIPSWALMLGGVGIVMGLAVWGWRVIETVGEKITELTPMRGFAAEFGAAFTVLLASKLGLPISTTHTLIGAILGVGLARGFGALNFGTMREIAVSWMVTVPAGAFMSIFIFAIISLLLGNSL